MPASRDVAASVRARLLTLSRERREEFQGMLTRYVVERLLYRLGRSDHHDRFVLKGALLFAVWGGEAYRPTRDLDLLGQGDAAIAHQEQVFREICQAPVEGDGVEFLPETVAGMRIREDQIYEGVRIRITARLAGAVVPIQVDIGFGDIITPAPVQVEYPALLEFPAPQLQAYPRETVIAEKLQAMVALGIANSRMKDFYDLWVLARHFSFDGRLLCRAIQSTLARRGTVLPLEAPLALTGTFFEDPAKRAQWKAFLRRARLDPESIVLDDVAVVLQGFLLPPLFALARREPLSMYWTAPGPWTALEGES